jgi:hypothetical protein
MGTPLKLANPITVSGTNVEASAETATHILINSLEINLEKEGYGSCVAGYEYGNVVETEFVPLPLIETHRNGTITIAGDDFYEVANTAISPSERYLTLYDIIKSRIMKRMTGINLIQE